MVGQGVIFHPEPIVAFLSQRHDVQTLRTSSDIDVGRHECGIIEVKVLQVSGIVASVGPRTPASQIAQHVEVTARDGTDDFQSGHFAVVALDAVDVSTAPNCRNISCGYRQAQFLSNGVRIGHRNGENFTVQVIRLIGIDMVSILRPALTIELAEALRHENLEIAGQVFEGIVCQTWHAIVADVNGHQVLTVGESRDGNGIDSSRDGDGLQIGHTIERTIQRLHFIEETEIVEVLDGGVTFEDAFYALEFRILRGEVMSFLGKSPHHVIALHGRRDVHGLLCEPRVAHIGTHLRRQSPYLHDRSLPRVATRACGRTLGKEHELLDAADILQNVAVVFRGLAPHADTLHRCCFLEDVLTDERGRLGEDDRLDGMAVLEEIVRHLVVIVNIFVNPVAIVAVALVFLDIGIPQVEVAQTAFSGVAVVGISPSQMANDSQIFTVQRANDGKRVVLSPRTIEIAHLAALLCQGQPELGSQLPHIGDGDHFVDLVLGIADDVRSIVSPCQGILISVYLVGGNINLQTFVAVESIVPQRGGSLTSDNNRVELRTTVESALSDEGHACRQLYLLEAGTQAESPVSDGLNRFWQNNVAQVRTVFKPGVTHIVETHTLEMTEIGKRVYLVLLFGELPVKPRESCSGNSRKVDVVFPVGLVCANVGWVVVGHVRQSLLDTFVAHFDDTGQETLLIGSPRRVVLEPTDLLRQHLQTRLCLVEHALANRNHLWCHRRDVVQAVGHHVEQVEVGQVGAIHES